MRAITALVALVLGLAFSGPAAPFPIIDADPPAPPPPRAGSVFDGNGLLVASADAADPVRLCARERAAGFAWVAVEVHDGAEPRNAGGLAAWVARLRACGFAVGGWGVERGEAELEAAAAAAGVERYDLAFYIADAEFSYGYAGPERSARFARAFRQRAPALPAALSSFGRVDGDYGMDWAAWRDAGFEFLPQAYLPDGPAFAPERCVAAALAVWPRGRVHPTLGLYGGLLAADYAVPAGGFSVFPGEALSDADVAALT